MIVVRPEVSIMEKATRLRAVAHTYAEGAKERRDREQAAVALTELEDVLDALQVRVEAARAAAKLGVPLPDITALVSRGLANLEAKASDGLLPTRQALQAARGKLAANRSELEAALGAAWKVWAAARVAEIPEGKVALVSTLSRQSIADDLRSLGTLARMLPRADDVESFARKLTRVRRALDAVEPDDDIVELLARLGTPEGVALADLTDTELARLRGNSTVADQIVLRRR